MAVASDLLRLLLGSSVATCGVELEETPPTADIDAEAWAAGQTESESNQ